jgi:hypothetical protein
MHVKSIVIGLQHFQEWSTYCYLYFEMVHAKQRGNFFINNACNLNLQTWLGNLDYHWFWVVFQYHFMGVVSHIGCWKFVNNFHKSFHYFHCCTLSHLIISINYVNYNSISQNVQGNCALLNWVQAYVANCTLLLQKIWIMYKNIIKNVKKNIHLIL